MTPITSPSEPRTLRLYHAAPGAALGAPAALGAVLAGIASLLAVSTAAVALGAPQYAAMGLGQLAMAATAVAIARAAAAGAAPRALGLTAPAARFAIAGALVGASAWLVNLAIVSALVTVDSDDVKRLAPLVHQPPLPAVVLAVAVAPALCEELVFRGALLRGLAARLPAPAALVASAALFAAYHVNPVQMIPTFLLGLALGFLALRAGSIAPAVLAHFLNNAMVIAVERDPSGPLARALLGHPGPALAALGALLAAGLALAARTPIGGRAAAPTTPGAPGPPGPR